jgi:hypothetical protein
MSNKNRKANQQNQSWRDFEQLVTRIEKVLAPQEAIVRSPDRIPDMITKELREVDASIRYKVGTTNLLIIIECRDRKQIQDTLWIEQVHSKQEAIGAAKCIVVSSSGFTRPAVKKAKLYGIEIRNLKRINQEVIQRWAPLRTWFYNYQLGPIDPSWGDYNFSCLDYDLDRKINDELSAKFYIEDPLLIHNESRKKISLSQYIEDLINFSFSELKPEDRIKIQINEELIMSYCGAPEYFVEGSFSKKYLIGIAFGITFLSIHDYSLRPTAVFDYSDENSTLVTGIEFDSFSHRDGSQMKMGIHTDLTTKGKKVSIWKEGNKNKKNT